MGTDEVVACNICETSQYEKKLYAVRSGHLVACSRCGLYYANPRRTDDIQAVLTNATPTELWDSKKLNYQGRIAEFKAYLSMINAVKQHKGKILDVGCYEGYFLDQARADGWECYGVEPNLGGAKYAREQLGLNVNQCILQKAAYDDDYFDVITILASLEHMPDPYDVLKEVRRIIKSHGVLLVTVPTIPFYLPILRGRWRMFIGDHYYFFTDVSMRNLLAKAGFKLLSSQYVTKSVDLDTISARLADEWQPNNLGRYGKFLRKIILSMGIEKLRCTINLFDTKAYLVHPDK